MNDKYHLGMKSFGFTKSQLFILVFLPKNILKTKGYIGPVDKK